MPMRILDKMNSVSVIRQSWNEMLKEDTAMQEQDIKEYYKHVFTLKSGRRIEILTWESYDKDAGVSFTEFHRIIKGFILTPLIVEKMIKIRKSEIAAREEIKDPCVAQVIPWPEETEGVNLTQHPIDCICAYCGMKRLNKINNKSVEEMSTKELLESSQSEQIKIPVIGGTQEPCPALQNIKLDPDVTKQLISMEQDPGKHSINCNCPECSVSHVLPSDLTQNQE